MKEKRYFWEQDYCFGPVGNWMPEELRRDEQAI